MYFVSSAAVPYFLPLVKYQLSYTRILVCGRKLHTSDRKGECRFCSCICFFITEDSHMTWDPTENNVFAIFLLGQCSPSETFEQDLSQD